jgi:hypothetical protein
MDNIIVYLDDAAHALQQLTPMKTGGPSDSGSSHETTPTRWILAACPPRLTRHINKWVNHSARQNWRNQWSERVFAQIVPLLETGGDTVVTVVASGQLTMLTDRLQREYRPARVFDARRTRFGEDLPPVTRSQPIEHDSRWSLPGAIVGMGAVLVLATD